MIKKFLTKMMKDNREFMKDFIKKNLEEIKSLEKKSPKTITIRDGNMITVIYNKELGLE